MKQHDNLLAPFQSKGRSQRGVIMSQSLTRRDQNEYDALLSSSSSNSNSNKVTSYGGGRTTTTTTTTSMEEGASALPTRPFWTRNDEKKEEEGSSSDDYSSHDMSGAGTKRGKTSCSQWTSFACATCLPLVLIALSAWLLLIVTRRGTTESLFHAMPRYDYIIVGGGPAGIVTVRQALILHPPATLPTLCVSYPSSLCVL